MAKKDKYGTPTQPMWETTKPDVTVESSRGRRIHVFKDKNIVLVTGKDWEKGGKLLPGKTVQMNLRDMEELMTGYVRDVFGVDVEFEE